MEKINCTIERITFQNPENGYSVLQATVKGYREEQTIVGTFHEVTVGAVLIVEGNWRVDKRYGRQFAAESWSETLPATVIGIEKYLGSGLVKGIAQAHQKSTYQVILRWHLQSGIIAIPGSSNSAHIAEDYDIFDFSLTPDDMQRINDLECGHRFASY